MDKEFYTNEVIMSSKREISQASACDSSKVGQIKFFRNVGSNTLTIGAPGQTRTGTPFDSRF
jgi:hypothetical protein